MNHLNTEKKCCNAWPSCKLHSSEKSVQEKGRCTCLKTCDIHWTNGKYVADATPNTEEWEDVKLQLSQAILAALEYRGFYDCGKYLDDTFLEYIWPIISKLLKEEREKLDYLLEAYNRLEKLIPIARESGKEIERQHIEAEVGKLLDIIDQDDHGEVENETRARIKREISSAVISIIKGEDIKR